MNRVDINIQDLLNKYKSGLSASFLSKHYGVSVWSIITRINAAGVHVRSNKEQNEKRLNFTKDQKPIFMGIVDGLLLGDGQIDKKGLLRLEQSNKRHCWLEDVNNKIISLGGYSKIITIPPRIMVIEGRSVFKKEGSLLYTPAYVEIQEQRKRWYPEGIKRIPKDLELSPLTLAYWFAGDGTYTKMGMLTFCTNGFVKEDTQYLIELISNLGIEANIRKTSRKGQYTIGIFKILEAIKLKDIIEPFLPECCKYKLEFVRSDPPNYFSGRKLTDDQVIEIRNSKDSRKYLANKFNVSVTTIGKVISGESFKHLL